jgi:hypothetical protein
LQTGVKRAVLLLLPLRYRRQIHRRSTRTW